MFDVALLAQATTEPSTGGALELLNSSITLSQNTVEAWNRAWQDALDPTTSSLWFGLVRLGTILGALSILYLAIKDGNTIIERQSWLELARLFIWPLVIVFFLANNGALLAGSVGLIRAIGYQQVQGVLSYQLADLTFADALSRQGLNSAAVEALRNLYGECDGLPPEELFLCRQERQEQAEAIVAAAEAQAGFDFDALRQGLVNGVIGGDPSFFASAVRDSSIALIRALLFALQWMVVNLLEAALLLTALFAPVAMGLSLLPFQGRPILAWLTGFITLFGIQFGYNLITGLVANRIAASDGATAADLGFSMLLAIGAPLFATLISAGGGVAIYRGLSGTGKSIARTVGGLTATLAGAALTGAISSTASGAGSAGGAGSAAALTAASPPPTNPNSNDPTATGG